jgi:heme oxygenase
MSNYSLADNLSDVDNLITKLREGTQEFRDNQHLRSLTFHALRRALYLQSELELLRLEIIEDRFKTRQRQNPEIFN